MQIHAMSMQEVQGTKKYTSMLSRESPALQQKGLGESGNMESQPPHKKEREIS